MSDLTENSVEILLNAKVDRKTLAKILGVSTQYLYQEQEKNRLPSNLENYSYCEVLRTYIKYFQRAQDLKIEREKRHHEEKMKSSRYKNNMGYNGDDTNNGMHPLVAGEKIQAIKLMKTRTVKEWLTIAKEREELLVREELVRFITPFVQAIKNTLVSIGLDIPEHKDKIEDALNTLADMGDRIVSLAKIDRDAFIGEVLSASHEEDYSNIGFAPKELLNAD